MSFIVINKKTEEAIKKALLQLKNEVSFDIYKEIERILLNAIRHKRLSIYDVNDVFSLLNSGDELKSKNIVEEHSSKRKSPNKQDKRNKKKSFNFVFYEHLFIVKLLNIYKKECCVNLRVFKY